MYQIVGLSSKLLEQSFNCITVDCRNLRWYGRIRAREDGLVPLVLARWSEGGVDSLA